MPEDVHRIELIPLGELVKSEAERNPKDHDIGAIIVSLQRFGFVTPGIRNEKTRRSVAGHGRARALAEMKRLDMDPPRRIKKGPKGEWLVPVVAGIHFDSDNEAEAYVVADNRHTIAGGWNEPELFDVLSDIAQVTGGLEGTGFDGDDLDELGSLLATDFKDQSGNQAERDNNNLSKMKSGDGQIVRCEIGEVMTTVEKSLADDVWAYVSGGDDQRERMSEILRLGLGEL